MKENESAGQGSFAIVEERREDPLALSKRQSKTLSKIFGGSFWKPATGRLNSSLERSKVENKSTLVMNFQASSTIVQAEKAYSLDDIITLAGGFGRFQWLMMTFYVMSFWSANFVLYNIDYLTQKPTYLCEAKPGSGDYQSCSWHDICVENPPKYKIDWDDPNSLNNWSQTLDLLCVPDDRIQRISSIYYFGEIFGCLIVSRIPDIIGRKWPYVISVAL